LTIIPILSNNKEVEELVCSIEDIIDVHEEEKRKRVYIATNNHMSQPCINLTY
jgi:hypothetical protein